MRTTATRLAWALCVARRLRRRLCAARRDGSSVVVMQAG